MPDDDLIVKVSKVLDKGLVQIPLEMREKLDLQPGTKMIVYATEEGVVLRKADLFFQRETPGGLLSKIRGIFSKVPIRNIEE
jgi:AbrB family looped-hinge helix DNA binding protein